MLALTLPLLGIMIGLFAIADALRRIAIAMETRRATDSEAGVAAKP